MGDKEGSTQGRSYIVAGSSDTTVSMWTTTGVQLGTFGRGGSWDTSDPASWVGVSDDAKALEMDSLYYKVGCLARSPAPRHMLTYSEACECTFQRIHSYTLFECENEYEYKLLNRYECECEYII